MLDLGAMANPMFKGKGPGMVAGSFPTNFPLKHAQKDMRWVVQLCLNVYKVWFVSFCLFVCRVVEFIHLHWSNLSLLLHFCTYFYSKLLNRLALELAEKNNVSLPTTAAANAVYVKAMEECDAGDQDFSAVIQAYQK